MAPAERIQLAYRRAAEVAAELQECNDVASGWRLLQRAATVGHTGTAGPVEAADYTLRLAQEALNTKAAS